MPWFKVDDGFHGHPKVLDLSIAAVGLWTLAGSWASKYLTDGHVTHRAIARLGGSSDLAAELVEAGLWLDVDEGFQFKDWDEYQPLKDDVESERDAARERMRKRRRTAKGLFEGSSGEQPPNVQENFERSSSTPTHPDPSPSSKELDVPRKRATRIPEPFIVNGAMREWAAANAPNVDVNTATAKFVDYWRAKSGRDATKLDWVATWRNWLRTDAERHQPQAAAKPKSIEDAYPGRRILRGGEVIAGARD